MVERIDLYIMGGLTSLDYNGLVHFFLEGSAEITELV